MSVLLEESPTLEICETSSLMWESWNKCRQVDTVDLLEKTLEASFRSSCQGRNAPHIKQYLRLPKKLRFN